MRRRLQRLTFGEVHFYNATSEKEATLRNVIVLLLVVSLTHSHRYITRKYSNGYYPLEQKLQIKKEKRKYITPSYVRLRPIWKNAENTTCWLIFLVLTRLDSLLAKHRCRRIPKYLGWDQHFRPVLLWCRLRLKEISTLWHEFLQQERRYFTTINKWHSACTFNSAVAKVF